MSELTSHVPIKQGSDRNFGLVLGAAFIVIGGLPMLHGGAPRLWAFAIAPLLILPALFFPSVLKPLNRLWFELGLLLGRIVAPIVMLILFLVVFTPLGLIMRLFGKDPLKRKYDPRASTYWIRRGSGEGETPPMGSMKNQF